MSLDANALPVSVRDAIDAFPPDPARRYQRIAIGWAALFYASFVGWLLVGHSAGLPASLWVVFGVVCIVRNFNALHELFHANRADSWQVPIAETALIVMGPFQLGFDALRDNHMRHHRYEGGEKDPDRYLIAGNPLVGLLNSVTQPEQSVWRYVARRGWSVGTAGAVCSYFLVWVGLGVGGYVATGGWSGFIAYNVATRIGNTASWYIFDYWLHHEGVYGRWSGLPIPSVVSAVWAGLFSQDNLDGVRHHYLHHRYAVVPDRRLPGLANAIREPSDLALNGAPLHVAPQAVEKTC